MDITPKNKFTPSHIKDDEDKMQIYVDTIQQSKRTIEDLTNKVGL